MQPECAMGRCEEATEKSRPIKFHGLLEIPGFTFLFKVPGFTFLFKALTLARF